MFDNKLFRSKKFNLLPDKIEITSYDNESGECLLVGNYHFWLWWGWFWKLPERKQVNYL